MNENRKNNAEKKKLLLKVHLFHAVQYFASLKCSHHDSDIVKEYIII